MAQNGQAKSRRKVLDPIFHLQTEVEDNNQLTVALLKNTRKTGQLNLSGRNLKTIPERLWTLYEPGGEETSVNYDLCKSDDQPWWNYQPLQNLDISSNCITELPKRVNMFQDLTVLNIQDNSVTGLPNELGELTKLTKLNISRNKLTELPECVFKLLELRSLTAAYNNIETLNKGISDLVMLQQLDLSHNHLTTLPAGLGYMVRLTQLNLSYNKITELPPDIVNMRALSKCDLIHNELTCLPPLGELRKLQFFYATHNNIQDIPDCMGCENLQELHLGNNFIKDFRPEICESLSHLKILDIRDNKIEELPETVLHMQQLIRLDLSNNTLSNLPNSLSLLAHLQSLQIEGNLIRSIRRDIIQCGTSRILKFLRERYNAENTENIPPNNKTVSCNIFPDRYQMRNTRTLNLAMKELLNVPDEVFFEAEKANVVSVDLCRNKLPEVPSGLSMLLNITELNLSVNQVQDLPEFICGFERLQYLNVSCNLLTDLPKDFSNLKYLRELVISNNRFNSIPHCVYEMEGLEILLSRENKINKIDVPHLSKLKRLTVLDLANNNLDYIPPELGNLTNIRSLEINGNSFRQPRYAILSKGTDEILAYLRDRIPV